MEGDIIVLATDGLWDNLHEMSLLNNISELKVCYLFFFISYLLKYENFNFPNFRVKNQMI